MIIISVARLYRIIRARAKLPVTAAELCAGYSSDRLVARLEAVVSSRSAFVVNRKIRRSRDLPVTRQRPGDTGDYPMSTRGFITSNAIIFVTRAGRRVSLRLWRRDAL